MGCKVSFGTISVEDVIKTLFEHAEPHYCILNITSTLKTYQIDVIFVR
jgi:hypothetical protein